MSETQERTPVQPEDILKLKALQNAKLSPDGKTIVYNVAVIDKEKEGKYESRAALWLLDVASGESRRLTAGVKMDTNPAWSPDGSKIAFRSSREGSPQIYVIPVDGGEAKPITSMKQAIGGGPAWSPDGKYIAFTAGPKLEAPPDPSKPYRVTRNVYRFDGIGYLHYAVQDIYIVPADGGDPKQLTDDAFMNINPTWSPDGQEILFHAGFDPNAFGYGQRLKLVNLQGEVRTIVDHDWGQAHASTWTPDGKHIVFIGQRKGLATGSKNDLYVIKRHGSEPVCRTSGLKEGVAGGLQPDFPAQIPGIIGVSKDRTYAYTNVQTGGCVQVFKIALYGNESYQPVITGERAVALTDISAEKLVFCESVFQRPPDVFIADLDGKNEKQLTDLNAELLNGWKQPELEHFLYTGAEDVEVEGWYVRPVSGEAPYPTILYIHGGPTGAFGYTYHFDFQMFAAAGYGVLFINPQGSSGYGDAYSTAINPNWGDRDYRDLMAGVDYVVEKGWADPERLGVSGISYGGYMSCWIVGHTDRFKAAIPENPVVDWISMYGVSDISAWLCAEAFGGKPHEVPEQYRSTAPITYAHNCTTPTLLIQGEQDFRCPAIQSEQFYTTLKANGCIVEMIRVPGGSHIMSIGGDPAWRKMQNEEMLKWFDRFVLGKTPE
jgi:dipeptidyl aminopeptidase/acylaminoacyl peptidase